MQWIYNEFTKQQRYPDQCPWPLLHVHAFSFLAPTIIGTAMLQLAVAICIPNLCGLVQGPARQTQHFTFDILHFTFYTCSLQFTCSLNIRNHVRCADVNMSFRAVYMHKWISLSAYPHLSLTYTYIYIYICVCIYIYVYISDGLAKIGKCVQ